MVALKVASHLKNLLGTEGVLFFTVSPAHPRHPMAPSFSSSFVLLFLESQINTSLMCSGCLGREVWGTLPWQAAQMEGPGCPWTAGSVRAVPIRGSFPAGQRRPGCSSSLRAGFGDRSRKWDGGPALRGPGSSEFRASLLSLLARVTASAKPEEGRACEPVGVTAASLDARGGTATRPPPRTALGLPARSRRPLDSGAQFAQKPTASLSCARGYVREGRPRGSGPRVDRRRERPHPRPCGRLRVGGPRWPPGPSPASARARKHPGPMAGTREPAARPRIYIFPSLGAGVRLCILMRSCERALGGRCAGSYT